MTAVPVSWAQDDDYEDIGGPRIDAHVKASAYFTDNFFNQPSNETEAYGTVLAPSLELARETGTASLVTTVAGEFGAFDIPGSADDYTDGSARVTLKFAPTLRNRLSADAGFKRGHDPFGANRTEDASVRDDELDLWNQTSAGARYRYGTEGAKLNAEVGGSLLRRHYTTNRSATQPLDYDATTLTAALYYWNTSKTAVVLDASQTEYEFDYAFTTADSRAGDLVRARAGVKWQATAKTSGDLRVGYRERNFDSGADSIGGIDWEAGIEWRPTSRTQFQLDSARAEQQSYRSDSRVIDLESARLTTRHAETERVRAEIVLEYIEADFEGSGRTDEIWGTDLKLEYLASSYLWLVGTLGTATRDSTIGSRDYDRLSTYLGVRLGR